MAPVQQDASINEVEDRIKDTIQTLYQLLVQTSSYDAVPGPRPSRDVLASEVKALSESLAAIHTTANAQGSALPSVPLDLIQYVESGRNPDIYTREFVELVRRHNQIMRGKADAFGSFRDVLAEQIGLAMPELKEDADRVVEHTKQDQAE